MNNIERRDAGLPYISDAEVLEQAYILRLCHTPTFVYSPVSD